MKRWASFVSGGGTTTAAIFDAIIDGRLRGIKPTLLVASKAGIGAIEKVRERISVYGKQFDMTEDDIVVAERRELGDKAWTDKLYSACFERGVDVITQNGWLPKTPEDVIRVVNGNIFNQHPGPLDPGYELDFGGGGALGMYGRRVHCARLLFARRTEGNEWTEATCHMVTPEIDKGSIVLLRNVEIFSDDTVDSLQQRVLHVEHQVQIDALQSFAQDLVPGGYHRAERLVKPHEITTLIECKAVAVDLYPNG